ncbi:hypothetical protein RRG08_011153 [Elysia crispata]|uniref:Uncharacterized protein n=1 Tax=Elysia crispata TaxID=231223 RepID=A0AAE1DQH6_9GAST|nr:hypothetical protein RRG08_011153 [Elysia crispata]
MLLKKGESRFCNKQQFTDLVPAKESPWSAAQAVVVEYNTCRNVWTAHLKRATNVLRPCVGNMTQCVWDLELDTVNEQGPITPVTIGDSPTRNQPLILTVTHSVTVKPSEDGSEINGRRLCLCVWRKWEECGVGLGSAGFHHRTHYDVGDTSQIRTFHDDLFEILVKSMEVVGFKQRAVVDCDGCAKKLVRETKRRTIQVAISSRHRASSIGRCIQGLEEIGRPAA